MYHLIDAWSPSTQASDRIEWFDKLVQKVVYQDVAGNTFMVEDDAVNNHTKRERLQATLHKSLMLHPTNQSKSTTVRIGSNQEHRIDNAPRMYRPRRMSLHRGMVGGDMSMFTIPQGTPSSSSSSTHTPMMSSSATLRLEGSESDVLVASPTIKATVVQRGGSAGASAAEKEFLAPASTTSSRRHTPTVPKSATSYDIAR